MDTGVYANNREICSKASDGASTAAFPDPCWTPPTPPVVVPYPNTAKAEVLDNGSTTVFIKNTMIAKEDRSYFAKSSGDDGATQGQPKGVATGVIQGKAYFQSWSQNVKVEGLCVARHQDMMTHNHGSFPSNTPLFPYISRGFFGGHTCKKEQKKIERACKPEKDDSETKKELKKDSKLSKILKSIRKKKDSSSGKKSQWHWTDDHCDGLDIPLDTPEKAKEYYEQVKEGLESIPDELNLLNSLESYLGDLATNTAMKVGGKWVAKAGAKQLGGTAVPGWGNAAMGIWSVVDGVMSVGDYSEIKAVAEEALDQLKVLKDKLSEIQKLGERIKDLKPEDIHDLAADGQDMLAALNACTRARKCNLVPYKNKNTISGVNKQSKVETAGGKGCCPGQTGHHLLNNKMIEDTCPGWTGDQANLAPTVCVEGTSWHKGSHGRVHSAMAAILKGMPKASDGTISLDQAMDAAAASHMAAFPYAGCSYKCIREQLEEFYKICKGSRAKAVDEHGKEDINIGNDL